MISRRLQLFATMGVVIALSIGAVVLFGTKKAGSTMEPLSDAARSEAISKLHQSPTIVGGNRFAFKLLLRLAAKTTDQENLFISPFSIEQAILLTANGAAGKTQEDLLHSLQLPADINAVNTDSQLLGRLLVPKSQDYEWTLANAIWTVRTPDRAFAERCARFYRADAFPLTGVEPINTWANQKTNGRIPEILDQLPGDTTTVLTNAVYFKGKWMTEFEATATEPAAPFFTPGESQGHPVPRMNETEDDILYHAGKDFQAVSLPYRGGMEMVILLPNKGTAATRLAAEMDETAWQAMQAGWQASHVHVGLPKFELEYGVSLLPDMEALGMPAQGDFSPMGPNAGKIDEILHKTFLRVDEKGTEAAAVTAVVMTESAMVSTVPLREFIVDRPFVCAIVHQETGAILFLGVINNPHAPKS